MARETFIDTGGFYALLVRNDARHGEAKSWLERIEAERLRAVTTDYVLDETATLMKAKGHGHLLRDFFTHVEGSEAIRIEWTDRERFLRAREFFLRHDDHGYSFTDCVSFVVMKAFALHEALTKAGHFREAGFKALLLD
jgi:predicted nucleic acid-binding protein